MMLFIEYLMLGDCQAGHAYLEIEVRGMVSSDRPRH